MKEHEDDVLPTVKESTTNIHSTPVDETVTVRGKIEGLFGQRDEGDDMVVDVVGADVAVDDRGGTKVDLEVGFTKLSRQKPSRVVFLNLNSIRRQTWLNLQILHSVNTHKIKQFS
ncbi:hypothetical protein LXL04_020510 [Taraxacum kok-saghyz]